MKELNAKYYLEMDLNLKFIAIFLLYLLLGEVRSDLAALDLTSTTQNKVIKVQIMSRFNFKQKCTNKEYLHAE
jgi:hypothetical protein